MLPYNYNLSNDLTSTPGGSYGKAHTWDWGLNSSGLDPLRAGPDSIGLCRTGGLRLLDVFVEFALWKRLRADDHFLYGNSDQHQLRYKQHTELGGSRSDEYCHHAGDIHVHIGKRFNEHEPSGDDHLHADGDRCRRLDHVYANRYRKRGHFNAR